MDFVNKLAGDNQGGEGQQNNNNNNGNDQQNTNDGQQSSSGGGFMDKINGLAGGGKDSEKNEDYLDKGVDFVQEKFMGGGAQDNESAIEQAKDEKISDFIRDKYKSATGSDIPIEDKETRLG
ncbi:hypothetical protein FH972_021250 [Carpinus fangiana]|uniref:DNA damage-responsive protein 48 n=1 Tax=Carpinus fangiana TaxID=176857 RepID=A0A5N6KPD5_9ROSI|nr:hypothetical protein FH972_021250 [Carpinus fangiana]